MMETDEGQAELNLLGLVAGHHVIEQDVHQRWEPEERRSCALQD